MGLAVPLMRLGAGLQQCTEMERRWEVPRASSASSLALDKCALAGAYVAEFNFRNCWAKTVCSAKLKDKFIDIMAVIAEGELGELITYTE